MSESQKPQPEILIDKRFVHVSDTLLLVPYLPRHVPKYHRWISNAEIMHQTATEYASLEQEYEMQITWATDHDKRTCIIIPRGDLHALLLSKVCTKIQQNAADDDNQRQQSTTTPNKMIISDITPFIPFEGCIEYIQGPDAIRPEYIVNRCVSLDKQPQQQQQCHFCGQNRTDITILNKMLTPEQLEALPLTLPSIHCCLECEINAAVNDLGADVAVGDVNLFLHEYLQDEAESDSDVEQIDTNACVALEDINDHEPCVAEIEIMIAEQSARRKGYGSVAIKLITQYAIEWLSITRFIAKINDDNAPSIAMFTNSLHYTLFAKVECFEELHFHWKLSKAAQIGYPFYPDVLTEKLYLKKKQQQQQRRPSQQRFEYSNSK